MKVEGPGAARAVACTNIALAKYWGKADVALNVPAVPSISMTLDGFRTETVVAFEPRLRADVLVLNGRPAGRGERARVAAFLDLVRERSGVAHHARVVSENNFPTASGLASSASGFAALAGAALFAAGVRATAAEVSRWARRGSASAARSVFGGFAELPAGRLGQASLAARALHGPEHWDLRMVVCVTAEGPKAVGSTSGMELTRRTSPYYDAWVTHAPKVAGRVRRALRRRDLRALGEAMEESTFAFHATALASAPPITYFLPATLAVYDAVRALRAAKVPVYATMDAGPHVKALCHAKDAARVRRVLGAVPGVLRTHVLGPGPGLQVTRGPRP